MHSLSASVLTDETVGTSIKPQQTSQDGHNRRKLETKAIPQFRPYGSLGQDGRYQNGEYLSGPRSQPNQTNSRNIQSARLDQTILGQHSQHTFVGSSSQSVVPTTQNQKDHGVSELDDDDEPEPDPGFLASCDYHCFLSDTVNTQTNLITGPTIATQANTAVRQLTDADVDFSDFGAASTAIKDKSAEESQSVPKKHRFPFKTL